jgi:hypothetical protein
VYYRRDRRTAPKLESDSVRHNLIFVQHRFFSEHICICFEICIVL